MTLSEFIFQLKKHSARLASSKILPQPGEHHSSRKTLQAEIEDRRPYYPGDDIKYLDWKQYARSDRYYVKQASTPSKSKFVFILDDSSSMFTGENKFSNTALTMLALIYNALQSGDRTAVSLLSEKKIEFPLKNHFPALFRNWTENKKNLTLNIKKNLSDILLKMSRKSYVVFASDLYISSEDLKEILLMLHHKKSEALFLHSLDPREGIPVNNKSWNRLIDTESGKALLLSPSEIRNISTYYSKAVLARKKMIRKYHFSYYYLDSSASPFFHISKLYGLKF